MNGNYKYNPDDFEGMISLSEDLSAFYQSHMAYLNDRSMSNKHEFERVGRDLFFTVKHREIETVITSSVASGLREYMNELLMVTLDD